MQAFTEGKIIVAKFDDGEKIVPTLLDVVEDQDIYSGMIISGIGMLRDFTLNYFDGKRYVERQYQKPMELLSLQGSVATDSSIHLHAMLGNKDNKAIGGHLSRGTVSNLLELTILKLDDIQIKRRRDPNTTLSDFYLEKKGSVSVKVYEDEDED